MLPRAGHHQRLPPALPLQRGAQLPQQVRRRGCQQQGPQRLRRRPRADRGLEDVPRRPKLPAHQELHQGRVTTHHRRAPGVLPAQAALQLLQLTGAGAGLEQRCEGLPPRGRRRLRRSRLPQRVHQDVPPRCHAVPSQDVHSPSPGGGNSGPPLLLPPKLLASALEQPLQRCELLLKLLQRPIAARHGLSELLDGAVTRQPGPGHAVEGRQEGSTLACLAGPGKVRGLGVQASGIVHEEEPLPVPPEGAGQRPAQRARGRAAARETRQAREAGVAGAEQEPEQQQQGAARPCVVGGGPQAQREREAEQLSCGAQQQAGKGRPAAPAAGAALGPAPQCQLETGRKSCVGEQAQAQCQMRRQQQHKPGAIHDLRSASAPGPAGTGRCEQGRTQQVDEKPCGQRRRQHAATLAFGASQHAPTLWS
mmetsp:Transcript_25138/g.79169  ORF Transcript_25138/g.79169 Transcript_25138/m.79169 type:complete len:422 (-) Transcript_25138:82-1347(-)